MLMAWASRPEKFEFVSTGRKHANFPRKSSSSWSTMGIFHSPRLSRAYTVALSRSPLRRRRGSVMHVGLPGPPSD
jgi:hypothetical protein